MSLLLKSKTKITLLIFFFTLCFSSQRGFAQVLQNFVIVTQGDFNESSEASISWTLGEVASAYFINSDFILNEGFNQPFEEDGYTYPTDEGFLVFPNPTVKDLIITFKDPGQYRISIYDVIGQIVLEYGLDGAYLKLDLSHLANALYLIKVKNESQSINSTIKFIKTD